MRNDIRLELLLMRANDEEVSAELASDGSLFFSYHIRMEQVHRANANVLRAILQRHGWPHENLVNPDGAEAAWLIAQHSIGEPSFMRWCRQLINQASDAGLIPRWHFAYIDDRIRVFEGSTQRFGTQIDLKPDGAQLHELEDPRFVDAWRQEVGLGSLRRLPIARADGSALPTQEQYDDKQAAELNWRRLVGWIR
jgi:hypothetical protein